MAIWRVGEVAGLNSLLLGFEMEEEEVVAYEGGDIFEFGSRVRAIVSGGRKGVDLFF